MGTAVVNVAHGLLLIHSLLLEKYANKINLGFAGTFCNVPVAFDLLAELVQLRAEPLRYGARHMRGKRERGERERREREEREREREREREKRLHSPFALHAPIQWAI